MPYKILFAASTFSHIANFHRPYLREFARLGWEVHIACGGAPVFIPEAQSSLHIPFEKSMTSPKNLQAIQLLRHTIREQSYDLISCHTSLAAFFTRLAVLGLRKRPLIAYTCHGYLFDDRSPRMKRALLSGAEQITAPVTDLLMTMNAWDDHYARDKHLGRDIVHIPGMGVDFSRLDACPLSDGMDLRRRLGFTAKDKLFLYAAEFSPRKSQSHLIRAMTKLPDSAALLLPGDGALREDCMRLAASLGLEKRVIFPGHVSDMPLWYCAADAAVSSSRSEGLPFNIMEAMYCSLPVIASNVKGHQDLIHDGENGLLFPYGDWETCAQQMNHLLLDPDSAVCLGTQAHKSVLPYALDQVLPQVMAQYRLLLPLETDLKTPAAHP